MDEITRLHQLWRQYFRCWDKLQERYNQAIEAWWEIPWPERKLIPEPTLSDLPFPEELRGLTCGAKTRAGTPCKLTSIYINGRCKFHGGLSSGPTTPHGKRRSAMNGKCLKAKRTP
jgi:hypothetical protein